MKIKIKQTLFASLLLLNGFVALADDFSDVATFVRGTGFKVICESSLTVDAMRKNGPHFYIHSTNSNPAEQIPPSKLKIMFYNFLNLSTSPGKYQDIKGIRKWVPNPFLKSEEQIQGTYRLIQAEDPDLIVGSEIEALDSMEKSNRDGFKDRYFSLLIPDYDQRINIGFFIKKFAFDIEVQSYRELMHEYLGEMHHLFSRDLPVLIFRKKGSAKDSVPVLIVLGTHFKSMRDTIDYETGKVIDRESRLKNTAQVEATAKIMNRLVVQYPGVPTVIGGDFNAPVETSPVIDSFTQKTGFSDAFDVVGLVKNSWARATYSHFPNQGVAQRNQIDAAFIDPISKKLGRLISAYVAPHRYPDSRPKPLPPTKEKRDQDASDHRAVVIELDISKK